MTIEDKLKWHGVATDVRDIPEKAGSRTLHDLLFEEVSSYYNANKDNKKGHMKFKDDDTARSWAAGLWDKAADHVARQYLKLDDTAINKLKNTTDEDGNNLWETHMQPILGVSKDGFQDQVVNLGEINPQNINDLLVNPLYQGHIQYRTSARVQKDVRTIDDAKNAMEYLKLVKGHNPETYKHVAVPKKIASVQDAANALVSFGVKMPKSYHPDKRSSYEIHKH